MPPKLLNGYLLHVILWTVSRAESWQEIQFYFIFVKQASILNKHQTIRHRHT